MTDLDIAAPLAAALAARGYETLTPVQEAVLASAVTGRDLLVSAQTGSGKTVAFGIAIADELLRGADRLLFADVPMALIIAPTRELALQVARELDWLYGETGAQIATCVGGMDYRTEKRSLDRGAHIVVGTPGRLRDHIERRSLDLSGLRAAVLDEADEMLDLGFREDLEFILQAAPAERRTLMFSATVPKAIAELAKDFQRDALRLQTAGEARQHVDIEYRAMTVSARDREHAIFNLLRFYEARSALVFCKTRVAVNHLLSRMGNRGFQVVALSGELSQQERTHALQALRDGRARVCIATDVAARGIDLPGLDLVIHADLPSNSETLLHRSGRTGRAGSKGVSALIVTPAEFKKAQRLLQGAKVVADWGKAPSAEEVSAKDDLRLLDHPALQAAAGDDAAMAQMILERFGPEQAAAAFVRLWREGRSAPEVLQDANAAPAPARERAEFGASVWFSLSVGRSGRAEARWILPKICDAGGITKAEIGAIRVQQDETFVQIGASVAGKFGAGLELESGVQMRRLDGEPSMDRPERSFEPRVPMARSAEAQAERSGAEKPRSENTRSEKPVRRIPAPRALEPHATAVAPPEPQVPEAVAAPRPRAEKPAYVPKARRDDADIPVEEVAPAPRKPAVKRETKPYSPLDASALPPAETPRPRDEAARKPYVRRDEGKPHAARPAYGDKKPYAPREGGGKPYAPKSVYGEKKPYAPRAEGAKPHAPREGGAKPYAPKAAYGEKKPFAPRSDAAKPYARREEGDKKPYAPREGAAKPYAPRQPEGDAPKPRWADKSAGAAGPRSAGSKSHAPAGKPFGKPGAKPAGKPFAKPRPAAPRADATDTSKRFVPPKKPKA